MKLISFLDDCYLDTKIDLLRRFESPRRIENALPEEQAREMASTTFYPEERGYACWSKPSRLGPGNNKAFHYRSDDGIQWQKTGATMDMDPPHNNLYEQQVFHDPWDADSSRRFKMTRYPYRKWWAGPGILACSPDGIRWTNRPEYAWSPKDGVASDTCNNVFYNPFEKAWTVVCRKSFLDRRVALVHSSDLIHWSPPRVVLHPDSCDPDLCQFYGMKATLYDNELFVGLLEVYRVSQQDDPALLTEAWPNAKMGGILTSQLAYSYNGLDWLRSDRSEFIPRADTVDEYPTGMLQAPDGDLLIYARANSGNHASKDLDNKAAHIRVYRLRKDGFASLESLGGYGHLVTRTVVPADGAGLSLNIQAPHGRVLAQISGADRKPIPGYTFDDALPLEHVDGYNVIPRWKEREDIRELANQHIRVELKLHAAKLYAIRLECYLLGSLNTPFTRHILIERI